MNKILNTSPKNTIKYYNIRGFCLLALILMALAAGGCEEPLRTASSRSKATSTDNLMSEANRIILGAMADIDPRARSNAIEVIASTRQIRLMPKVQKLLSDQTVPVRFLAVLAVGDLKYSFAESQIASLLKDQNENVRIAAAYTLYKLGHQQYFSVFRNAIASEDQTVRANAALLLGKAGNQDAQKVLWWAIRDPKSDDKVIFNAIEALAMLGDEKVLEKAWAMLIKAYADERMMGLRVMGALRTEQAKNVLITMLDDPVLEVRLAAAQHLGRLGDHTGEPKVLEVFKKNLIADLDPQGQERVKVLTALAICEIGTDKLTRYLPRLLEDESKFVRIAAAKAIFQCPTMR